MKALLVIDDDDVSNLVKFYLKPLGFETIHYRNPVKALDNLEELDPDALVMSARDFPRHWKPLTFCIRTTKSKTRCVIVILKGDYFPFEEAAKAANLGVNGVIREDLGDKAEQLRFQQIFKRYVEVDESRQSERYVPSSFDRLEFAFGLPDAFTPITGKIESISGSGLSFKPDMPSLTDRLEVGISIPDAQLRAGDAILPLSCSLIRNGAVMAFTYESFGMNGAGILEKYLKDFPDREMDALLHKAQ